MIFNTGHGRFRLVKRLASGGMGEVCLALDPVPSGPARFVALKTLHGHLAGDHDVVEMFHREAALGQRFRHPNLVHVAEVESIDGLPTMVMDFAAGVTARELLRRCSDIGERVPARLAVEIARQAARGLHFAHRLVDDNGRPLNLVHRDVSPDNIQVGFDGVVRVLDFGVALAGQGVIARTGDLAGKVAYMSPEQCRGHELDARSDVFSLATVLWELLVGQRLFAAENDIRTLRMISEKAPAGPGRLAMPSAAVAIDRVFAKAHALDVDARYGSAEELAEALEDLEAKFGPGGETLHQWMQRLFRAEMSELKVVCDKILHAPRPGEATVDLGALRAVSGPMPAIEDDILVSGWGAGRSDDRGRRGAGERALAGAGDTGGGTVDSDHAATTGSGGRRPRRRSGSGPAVARRAQEAGDEEPDDGLRDPELELPLEIRWARRRTRRLHLSLAVLCVVFASVALIVLLLPDGRPADTHDDTVRVVRLTSQPPGAAIVLDGRPSGMTTPAMLPLSTARSTYVQLMADGHRVWTADVRVDRRLVSEGLVAVLEPDAASPLAPIGSLRVNYTPPDALLWLNGEIRATRSPAVLAGLPLNTAHQLRLDRNGHETLFAEVRLESGDPVELDLRMSEGVPLARVSVVTEPEGAVVSVNGAVVGEAPLHHIELPANTTYTLEVRHDGYVPVRHALMLRQEDEVVELALEPLARAPR